MTPTLLTIVADHPDAFGTVRYRLAIVASRTTVIYLCHTYTC